MELGVTEGGGVRRQNTLFKIATKQYLGHLMILGGGGWGGQNALFKIAAKQCSRLLMMLGFDT